MTPAVNVDFENIPEELRKLRQWILWRYEPGKKDSSKIDKIPYAVRGGLASSTNPATWETFEKVKEVFGYGDYSGIGFVFAPEGGYVGIDLDACLCDGKLAPAAEAIITRFGTYTEISPSGTGVKLWLRGRVEENRTTTSTPWGAMAKKNPEIAVFQERKYFCVTGRTLNGYDKIVANQEHLNSFFASFFRRSKPSPPRQTTAGKAVPDKLAKWAVEQLSLNVTDRSTRDCVVILKLVKAGCDQEAVRALVTPHSKFADRPDYFERTWQWAVQQPEASAADMTLNQQARLCTDVGNAARFAVRERDRVRYCYERDQWYVWDACRWPCDAGGEIASRAKRVALSIFDEAKAADGNEALGKWAACSQRRERLTAMIEVAKPELRITPRELDADDWLLNCLNGTIDLRSGELRPHRQDDYITRLAPVDYNPDAHHAVWDQFLATVTDGDGETQAFLQRAAGYSATGLTSEEKLFFIHGHGATGKSSFIEAVKTVLGDYATTADFETFLENRSTGPRNDVAALDGSRLVASVEVSDGRHLAQGLVKMLTGGDTVRARFLYREGFEFTPKFTLWLVANHAPLVDDLDDALWRRMVRIPFEHVIPEDRRDPGLKLRLKSDPAIQAAVLRWIVDGCQNWRDVGLEVPDAIRRATEQYREDQNPLGDFIADRCITGAGYQAGAGELRAAYLAFAAEQGLRATLSPRRWAERLRSMGVIEGRVGADSTRVWHGIGLLR